MGRRKAGRKSKKREWWVIKKGTYEFADGSKYEGEWKNQKKNGEGIFTYIDGNKWEGKLRNFVL